MTIPGWILEHENDKDVDTSVVLLCDKTRTPPAGLFTLALQF